MKKIALFVLVLCVAFVAGCVSEGAAEGKTSGRIAIQEPWPWGTDTQPSK